MLCSKEREIHFESKSQPQVEGLNQPICCVAKNEKYILKANHNNFW